jgi:16S rRNA U516 pseudouridylate synthase RsuA-like enzyme
MVPVRLDKFVAEGLGLSKKDAVALLRQQSVSIATSDGPGGGGGGVVVPQPPRYSPDTLVFPGDAVHVDGAPVLPPCTATRVWLVNKPKNLDISPQKRRKINHATHSRAELQKVAARRGGILCFTSWLEELQERCRWVATL